MTESPPRRRRGSTRPTAPDPTVTIPDVTIPSSASAEVVPAKATASRPTTTLRGAAAMAAAVPAGIDTRSLAADVSGQLATVAPTFGQVLGSIGTGVADSQTALDKGVVDTVKALADTDITVVTDVIQHLGDNGLPDVAQTELITQNLSVLNFFMPTVHEWKKVVLSMDLSVGAFDDEEGVSFNAEQSGGGVGGVGLFWGFLGLGETTSFDNTQSGSRNTSQEVSWSAGQVRLDATLGPRTTGKLPVPDRVVIGPQITMAQGTVKDTTTAGVTKRSVDVLITVLKRDGSANPSQPLTLDAGPLLPSFSTTAPFTGSITNADGQVKVTLSRTLAAPGAAAVKVPVTVRLNSFSQTLVLTI
jgi:hypothetical protein